LVQGQAKKQVLKKSYEQIQQFIFFQRNDADIYFLRGKVTLALNEYKKSEFSFKKALALGLPPIKAAPYQAELAFVMRRFDKVSQYFSQTDNIDNNCEIVAGMLQQWG
jgi:tetratricopeptide (TPR) repeat protein